MKALAVISRKRGAGQTTLALNLAVAAERAGLATAVIDLDPQASAKGWHDQRRQDAPAVISAQVSRACLRCSRPPAPMAPTSRSSTPPPAPNRPRSPPRGPPT